MAVCVDKQKKEKILAYVYRPDNCLKIFKLIVELILGGYRNSDLYDKVEMVDKYKSVTAMRFVLGRSLKKVYCKEQKINGLSIIVLSEIQDNEKTQEVTKQQISIIEKIASYDYQIE
jgi:hypothetical protein